MERTRVTRSSGERRKAAEPSGPDWGYISAVGLNHGRYRHHQSALRHLLLGMEHCIGLFGKRANLPVACLALLAALVPDHHNVTLIDENVEDIDFTRLARADLVCLTGMSIQGRRMREILERVRSFGVMTVVGGPLATVEEDALEGLADVVFVGEADVTWPQFLRDWERGCHTNRYEQQEKTDVTHLPLPRIELLKTDRYMFGSMQISRGCPFTCEFCDIIVTFGRRPRLKTSRQVLAELEAFLGYGLKIIFIVDDNLIGNKKAIKPILRDIVQLAAATRLPAHSVHRGLDRPCRGRGTHEADGPCQFPKRICRH